MFQFEFTIRDALLPCLIGVLAPALPSVTASDALAPFFHPPAEYREALGSYRSPLLFHDGRRVNTSADWTERRAEILRDWTEIMGAWPPLLDKPKIEVLASKPRESFTECKVMVTLAQGVTEEAYLLVPQGAGPFPAVIVPFYEPESSIGLKGEHRDFALQLTRRGFVTLSIGSPGGSAREPELAGATCQPLSFLAYVAANAFNALAEWPSVDRGRIGIAGHSYGGKWAMFAAALYEPFACSAWSDPGIVFDETRPNVNYWEPWYLGRDPQVQRRPGLPAADNPRTGAYRTLVEQKRDLHEIHALHAPRPFLVSGGAEDQAERWPALNHTAAINRLLGQTNRVAMTLRPGHTPTPESNAVLVEFFVHFLKPPARDR